MRRKWKFFTAVCLLGALAIVAGMMWFNDSSSTAVDDAAPAALAPEPTEEPIGAAQLQIDTQIAALESALSSGDAEELSTFVAMDSSEISEEFVSGVAKLDLRVPTEDATSIGEQLWNVTAIDRDGNSWDLGLLVEESQTTLFYAELAEAP